MYLSSVLYLFQDLQIGSGHQDHLRGKGLCLQQIVLGKLHIHIRGMKLDPYFTSYGKINSEWIKGKTQNYKTTGRKHQRKA